jgi:predicted nucleic acid-binding protein
MYFSDTYALVEIINDNPSYEKYSKELPICTVLNIFELHQALLREFNKGTADYWLKKFEYELIEITKEDAIAASHFRFKHKDKKLSSIDCIGYIVALKNNLKFLTGDKAFQDIENVEYVK